MPADAARRRAAERIEAVCRSAEDVSMLRVAVLDLAREVCPFDAHTWLLTDPETSVGAAPYAEVPCFSELPTLIRWARTAGAIVARSCVLSTGTLIAASRSA